MRRLLLMFGLLFAGVSAVGAQDSQAFLKVWLGTASCALSTGSGAPSGGATCDLYIDYATGDGYTKSSGGTWKKYTTYGTVTSVGLTLPAEFTVSGSPVTVSGTLSASWASQTTNKVFAAPNGSTGAPTFRALALADLPTTTAGSVLISGAAAAWSNHPPLTAITSPAATNLTLDPTGDIVLGPTGLDVLPNTGYTVTLGALTNKYLALHAAELWVETLVAQNTIATIGGRVIVAPTNILTADVSTGATTIQVKYNNLSSAGAGDVVYLEANASVEFMRIISGPSGSAGAYVYGVTRNLDGSGANAWTAGDALVNSGQTGKGFIDLYSTSGVLSGSGPTIVGNVRTGNTYNNISPRWAIGNLNGLYGYGAEIYGAAFGDPSGAWLKVDAINGLRLGFNGTTKASIDASGSAVFTGTIQVGPSPLGANVTMSAVDAIGALGSGLGSASGVFATTYLYAAAGVYEANGKFYSGTGLAGTYQTLGFSLRGVGGAPVAELGNDTTYSAIIGPVVVNRGAYNSGTGQPIITSGFALDVSGSTLIEKSNSTSTLTVRTVSNADAYTAIALTNSGASGVLSVSRSTGADVFTGSSAYATGIGTQNNTPLEIGINGTVAARFDTNRDFVPSADNTRNNGVNTLRWALVRGVTITSGDLSFENGWTMTEAEKVGIGEEGLAILDETGELVAFIGKTGLRRKGAGAGQPTNVDDLPYVKTTAADRAKMDRHPEQRVVDHAPDGTPIYGTKAAAPMPAAAAAQTNTQRKSTTALKAGGQQ
jgi:hypothetical protein